MIYDATIRPLPLAALIDLKGGEPDLVPRLRQLGLHPPVFGCLLRVGVLELLPVAHEHWLLLAPIDQEQQVLTKLLEEPLAPDTLILPVSDAYAFFSVRGRQARQVLAIASPLDTDPIVFPSDGATFSEAFGLKTLVIRRTDGFDLAVERSYASMMRDYLFRVNGGRRDGAE